MNSVRQSLTLKVVAIFWAAVLVANGAVAHEGHNHDEPVMVVAPMGGIIKSLEKTNIEVVSRGTAVAIYLYDRSMKPVETAGFKLTAKAELPRKKGSYDIKLAASRNMFEGTFDAKGIHRYTLKLTIIDPNTGHNDKLSFTIEPRRK